MAESVARERVRETHLAGDRRDLDVLMVPLPGSYEEELVTELEARGANVRTSEGPVSVLTGIREGGVPDVVHLHFLGRFVSRTRYETPLVPVAFGLSLLVELLVAKALGARVVWTVHNLVRHESRYPRIETGFRHAVARLCDEVLVHCDAAEDLVVDAYRLPERTREKMRTVPHGNYLPRYPDEVSAERARSELGVGEEGRTFLYFGHVRPYKNVDGLVRAFRSLDAPDAELLVVGNPLDEERAAEVDSLAADDDRIRTVLEYVPDEDVQLYMRAADVVVLPFESVLTSGSVILAMTFGRPVLAPRVGCTAELLDERGGFPYDPDDSEGLRRELRRALSADLAGMGEHNFETVEPLAWSGIAERTLDAYEGS